MVQVAFTPNIQRHVQCPTTTVTGATVREVLDVLFTANPQARGYVLDEQGSLRQHMVIFINGRPIRDRQRLTDAVDACDEIFVFQALSGG